MAFKRNKVIKEIKSLIEKIEKNGISIKTAYLFGSYARGSFKKWSDIDLLLVSDDFCGIRFYDMERLIPLTHGYNSLIELHPLKSENFCQEDLFVTEIVNTGIKLK
ncbi:MAG: nucleotidyltransferase domain-containing protein [Candidatus Hydrogenedentota bacterium]